jgi:glycosyltransferase involved in cell wall biosynthesis
MYLLSVIVPCYNSERKCRYLLQTLASLDEPEIEVIFVDDGSTDNTIKVLLDFQRLSKLHVRVVPQENKGPGGARNTGLKLASGKYVWFVDSDDDIQSQAIGHLKKLGGDGYDVIDFNHTSLRGPVNSIGLNEGCYDNVGNVKEILVRNFGPIWSKMILRSLIVENNIWYPEYCYYEDNALNFIYPFYVQRLYKCELVGYIYHGGGYSAGVDAVSRSGGFFDRMNVAVYGFKRSFERADKESERKLLTRKFVLLFLVNTAGPFMGEPRNWLIACRVMRRYREVAHALGLPIMPVTLIPGSLKVKLRFVFFYCFSFLLRSQESYFKELRRKAWGRPFVDPNAP